MKKKLLIPLLSAALILSCVFQGAFAYSPQSDAPRSFEAFEDESFPVLDYEAAQKQSASGLKALSSAREALPSKYDLLDYSWVSSVKNQGTSSLCWTFSAAAVAESAILKSGGPEMDFSEQHIAYSLSRYTSEGEKGNKEGFDRTTNGTGGASKAQAYLSRFSGFVLEKDDPFTFINETGAGPTRPLSVTNGKPKAVYVGDFINIPNPASRTQEQIRLHRETVKRCLMEYGAVGMAFNTSSAYSVTSTSQTAQGTGTLGNCYYDGTGSKSTNHLVTIIGWDDNYPRENFRSDVRPSSNGAFKIKNSLGTSYNDQGGYFWLSYEDWYAGWYGWCIEKVTPADTYSSVYYHDAFGATNYISGTSKIYGANVFKRKSASAETVTAVGVTVLSPNATVSVYVNDGKNNFTSSALTTRSFELPGYYTIPLDAPVTVNQSEFTVGAIFSAQSGGYPRLAYESPSLASLVTSSANESFYSSDGISYRDAGISYGNVSIRALTSENSVSLSKEELSMRAGQTAVLSASVIPNPAGSVKWTSSNTNVVTVKNGVLTAVAPGTATVTATADSGASGLCAVTVRSPLELNITKTAGTAKPSAQCTFTCALSENIPGKQFNFYIFRRGELMFTKENEIDNTVTYAPCVPGEYLLVAACRTGSGETVTNSLRFTVSAG